jgi:hypothetical protein
MEDGAEKAQGNRHMQAQLSYFRACLEHGEVLQKVAALDGMGERVISFENGSSRLVDGPRIEFTYQDITYRLDQIPGLIGALERALDADRRQACEELRAASVIVGLPARSPTVTVIRGRMFSPTI